MKDVRQRVLDSVDATLRTIKRPAFQTDGGLRVFAFRDTANQPIQAEAECPCFCYRETQEQFVALTAEVHEHTLNLEVSAHEVDSVDCPAKLRELRADIIKAFEANRTLDGLACYCLPLSGDIDTEVRGKNVGSIRVPIEVCYRTPAWDPQTVHERPA